MPRVLCYRRSPSSPEPSEPDSPSSPGTQLLFLSDPYSPSSPHFLDQWPDITRPRTVMGTSSLQLGESSPTSPLFHHDHEMWSDSDHYRPATPEWHSSDDEEILNLYCGPQERSGLQERSHRRQSDEYANLALEHYNNDEKNEVKYELIKGIDSCGMMNHVLYVHVNFIAKSTLKNSKEEFFFAELGYDRVVGDCMPTCIVSLEENERVDGFRGTEIDMDRRTERVDSEHCYACGEQVKHPVDGSLYEAGHFTSDGCYGHWD